MDLNTLELDPIVPNKQNGFRNSAASWCSSLHEIFELRTSQSPMASRLALHLKRIGAAPTPVP